MTLSVDDDELAACVSCGLCLPHCPTYRVTGDESASPRGRIAAMRAVHAGIVPVDDKDFASFMDLCVQCRGCETACPSSVPFGRLMEGARQTLVERTRYQPWWRRLPYRVLGHHRILVGLTTVAARLQRLGMLPSRRLGLPALPVRQEALTATGGDVWLFTGCVMDAWTRPTHAAAIRVLGAMDVGVALPDAGGDCCGALHAHAGLVKGARRLARRVMRSMPGDAPILVDSAGCGAALKEYAHMVGTEDAAVFSGRVYDIHEWMAQRLEDLPPARSRSSALVAVQDPCHLRHAQHAHMAVRAVLSGYVDLVELDDDGLCCGAGGAYSALHPEMAREIRARKLAAVTRSGATAVASANPGCAMHLAAAGLDVRHPMEIIADAMEHHGG